ncbi:NP1 [Vicugna pacos bocaparvovirus]|uniref:NP1 n=1 Tax=Vicugna pacos bocaparvovirus TaxID=2597326 RepID=A0A5J6BDC6_9VIRU|nr:NP1 [Vicugna pacos bocaparvovirus]QDQ17566.1 NP1 [Vicugna pacos bocaparvovirus]
MGNRQGHCQCCPRRGRGAGNESRILARLRRAARRAATRLRQLLHISSPSTELGPVLSWDFADFTGTQIDWLGWGPISYSIRQEEIFNRPQWMEELDGLISGRYSFNSRNC